MTGARVLLRLTEEFIAGRRLFRVQGTDHASYVYGLRDDVANVRKALACVAVQKALVGPLEDQIASAKPGRPCLEAPSSDPGP